MSEIGEHVQFELIYFCVLFVLRLLFLFEIILDGNEDKQNRHKRICKIGCYCSVPLRLNEYRDSLECSDRFPSFFIPSGISMGQKSLFYEKIPPLRRERLKECEIQKFSGLLFGRGAGETAFGFKSGFPCYFSFTFSASRAYGQGG